MVEHGAVAHTQTDPQAGTQKTSQERYFKTVARDEGAHLRFRRPSGQHLSSTGLQWSPVHKKGAPH